MKAIVLAGGFAKRMWPLTKDKPKHLLPIAGRPMLDFVLSELEQIGDFDKVYIATNAAFEQQFRDFLSSRDNKVYFELVIEPTRSEEEKLGAVGGLASLVKEKNIEGPLLVIGGDNLFDASIVSMIRHLDKANADIILLRNVNPELAHLYGIVSLDENDKIVGFEEKPSCPKGCLATTCCQLFTQEGINALFRYLDEGHSPDNFGFFMEWLCKNASVYGFVFTGNWFDIGSVEVYHEADRFFSEN